MASPVDVCNLALSLIGDQANVTDIDPPDGSQQAVYCAQFYPVSFEQILATHNWSAATKSILPSQLTPERAQWQYAYAVPSDLITVIAVLDKEAPDDYASGFRSEGLGIYTPQPYTRESMSDGTDVILTNQPDAMLRYVYRQTDLNRFSAFFRNALSYHLAHYLAGVIIKGDMGMKISQEMLKLYGVFVRQAMDHDSRQKKIDVKNEVPWLVRR